MNDFNHENFLFVIISWPLPRTITKESFILYKSSNWCKVIVIVNIIKTLSTVGKLTNGTFNKSRLR